MNYSKYQFFIPNCSLKLISEKRIFVTIFVFFSFFIFISTSHALDVSFTWKANTDTVDGYKLYYKTEVGGPPYNGTGALEGSSPVATGEITSFTLHNLSTTENYYFVLTATNGELESYYTQEIEALQTLPVPQIMSIDFQ